MSTLNKRRLKCWLITSLFMYFVFHFPVLFCFQWEEHYRNDFLDVDIIIFIFIYWFIIFAFNVNLPNNQSMLDYLQRRPTENSSAILFTQICNNSTVNVKNNHLTVFLKVFALAEVSMEFFVSTPAYRAKMYVYSYRGRDCDIDPSFTCPYTPSSQIGFLKTSR